MTKFLFASIIAAVFVTSVFIPNAFAQFDFNKIEGDEIQTNPISKDLLAKIELSKKQFLKSKEIENTRDAHQKLIDEQRILAKKTLEQELQRMNKDYEEFTPRNAFAKYVSNLNATYHGVFWDQFDYVQAKIFLAKDARDSVLNQGGTYVDAMKQYVQYAKMPKIEMQNIVRELNLKHSLAQNDTQLHFDINGKLPRYENDNESPCYGCTEKISKLKISSEQLIPTKKVTPEQKPSEINELRDSLSKLQNTFLKSKNMIAQKKIAFEMNEIVKQIQDLK